MIKIKFSKKAQKILSLLLLLAIFFQFYFFIKAHDKLYQRQFFPKIYQVFKDFYGKSQYVQAYNPVVIPDEYYYAYSSWEYVHGSNPIMLNAEQPPLGKYMIGLTEIFFNNDKINGLIFNLFTLLFLFLIAKLIFKNLLLSLLLVFLFNFEKLFIVQMLYAPLLDNIQLMFILGSFYFYLLSLKKKKFLIVAFIFLAGIISVKFWVTGALIFLTFVLHNFYYRLHSWKSLIGNLLLSFGLLLLTYTQSFFYGESLRRIIGVQKYIYAYHHGKFSFNPLTLWNLLLFNHWYVPWKNATESSVDWQLSWSVITILTILGIIFLFKRLLNQPEKTLLLLWCLIYLVFLFFGSLLARYLLPVLSIMYVVSMITVIELIVPLVKRVIIIKEVK